VANSRVRGYRLKPKSAAVMPSQDRRNDRGKSDGVIVKICRRSIKRLTTILTISDREDANSKCVHWIDHAVGGCVDKLADTKGKCSIAARLDRRRRWRKISIELKSPHILERAFASELCRVVLPVVEKALLAPNIAKHSVGYCESFEPGRCDQFISHGSTVHDKWIH
jgi:hypothetical protein